MNAGGKRLNLLQQTYHVTFTVSHNTFNNRYIFEGRRRIIILAKIGFILFHILFHRGRDSRKSRKKWQKNTANFCENRKNHGKITAKTRRQITGPKTIIQSIKLEI